MCKHMNLLTQSKIFVRNELMNGHMVYGKIQYYNSDLPAADAVYHQSCSVNFRTCRKIPKQYADNSSRVLTGRPINNDRNAAFVCTCEYFKQNDEENVSTCDLIGKMQEYLDDSGEDAYNRNFMIEKLKEHYGDEVIISSRRGQGISNVLTLRESADKVLGMYYKKPKNFDTKLQKRNIIEAAAKILKSDIKSSRAETFKEEYPSVEKLSLTEALSYIPESLQTFCRALFVGTDKERKIASIGQSIIQDTRLLSVIAPLQLGLAVQMHYHF